MIPPKIEESTKEERRAFVIDAWKCLHDCESCGKCRVLKGKDAETLYADYIEGKRTYMDVTLDIRIIITDNEGHAYTDGYSLSVTRK